MAQVSARIPATRLQIVGYWLLWVMVVGLPVLVVVLRIVTNTFGWLTVGFVALGSVLVAAVQLVFGVTATVFGRAFDPLALGLRATKASFGWYAAWLVLALTMNDATDGPIVPSVMTRAIGERPAGWLAVIVLLAGLGAMVATLAFIVADAKAAMASARAIELGPSDTFG